MMGKGWIHLTMMTLLVFGTTALRAQQADAPSTQSAANLPSFRPGTSPNVQNAPNPGAGLTAAPARDLTGGQVFEPVLEEAPGSFWQPAFACTEYATSNPSGVNRNSGLFNETACAGSITLQKVASRSQFNLNFTGGSFYYNRPYQTGAKQYGSAGALAAFEQLSGRRWTWTLGDQGTYLPEGAVGYEPFAGLAAMAGNFGAMGTVPALNGTFSPNQSSLGGVARRFSDLALSEFEYASGPRTTVTAMMTFGTQQFLVPGFIDNKNWGFTAGYNRALDRSNEVALGYDEIHYNFGPSQQTFAARGFSTLYRRSLTRTLTAELSMAPMVRTAGSTSDFFLATYNSLSYRAVRWDGTLRFDRMLTGGAGYLAGAETSQVMATLGRQLSHRVRGDLDLAYADNLSMTPRSAAALRTSYDYVLVGVNLTHQLGPRLSMHLNYSVQRATSSLPLCEGTTCSNVYLRQIGGLGIDWHAQPRKLD